MLSFQGAPFRLKDSNLTDSGHGSFAEAVSSRSRNLIRPIVREMIAVQEVDPREESGVSPIKYRHLRPPEPARKISEIRRK